MADLEIYNNQEEQKSQEEKVLELLEKLAQREHSISDDIHPYYDLRKFSPKVYNEMMDAIDKVMNDKKKSKETTGSNRS